MCNQSQVNTIQTSASIYQQLLSIRLSKLNHRLSNAGEGLS